MSDDRSERARVIMVAVGGYGYHYLRALVGDLEGRAVLAGVVDPEARRSPAWPEVAALDVPVCDTIEEGLARARADLVVIASPIHWHVPQACAALAAGSAVLCEKPVGATVGEVVALGAARDAARHPVAIGYQWSFAQAVLSLKRDMLTGRFGRPLRARTICCWPRDEAYYARNDWAGRMRHEATGRWVLDGPANNAMAHFLHNLLFLLGPRLDRAAMPVEVRSELYRAHAIESYDTVACRIGTDQHAEVLFYASHATGQAIEPRFRIEFEEAVVTYGEPDPVIVARDRRGVLTRYGNPDDTPQFEKLHAAIAAVREGRPFACGLEAASAQTVAVHGLHESVPSPVAFPAAAVDRGRPGWRSMAGLAETLASCYESARVPAEAGIPWAVAGRAADLTHVVKALGGAPAGAARPEAGGPAPDPAEGPA